MSVYGWKGIGHPQEANYLGATAANQFWGINPGWWYDWGAATKSSSTVQNARSNSALLAALEVGLQDPRYVPMLYCPPKPAPVDVANLARRYPGRVWLIFNEPDNDWGECGAIIKSLHPEFFPKPGVSSWDWGPLGRYLAEQYVPYYDAIRAADPYARFFALGLLQLPQPTLAPYTGYPEEWRGRAIGIWNAFTGYLKDPPDHIQRSLDGIAVHAYSSNVSTQHQGCRLETGPNYRDYACVQRALTDAYRFFQGTDGTPSRNTHLDVTAGKPIWVTEIGSLTNDTMQPWIVTRDNFERYMLDWFALHTSTSQDCQYINSVAWFSTHYTSTTTASDLLNYKYPTQQQLTEVGTAWRDAACVNCQCPGPDCR